MNNFNIKEVAIYPYNIEFYGVVQYLEKLNPLYRVKKLIMPYGYRSEGKDAGIIYNKPKLGINVTENFEEAIEECDCIIIAENHYSDNLRKIIIQNIELAIEKKKDIICTIPLNEEELKFINNKSSKYNINFTYYTESINEKELVIDYTRKLYTPIVPVIFVGEAIDGVDAFEVTVGITNSFIKKGYRTVTLTQKVWGNLLNVSSLPKFLWQNNMDSNEKVYRLNHIIKQLEQNKRPDIFIIQLPEAIMKYNDKLTVGFGIIPYLISLSVQADYFIFCSNYLSIESVYFDKLSEKFEHRFGFNIDAVHISNAMLDVNDSISKEKISSLHVSQNKVNEEVDRLNKVKGIPAYNCCNASECESLCDLFLNDSIAEII